MSKEDNYEDSFGVLGTLALAAAAGWVIHSINKSGKEAQAKREAQKQEEERRRNSPLSLNNGITLNEFVSMANHIASRTKRITEYLTCWGPGLLRLGAVMSFGGYCVSRPGLLRLGAVVG